MLQRFQTIYLSLIAILTILLCFIDIISAVVIIPGMPSQQYTLSLFYLTISENGIITQTKLQWGLMMLASIIIGLSVMALAGFKNRKKQMLYCKLNFIALIMLVTAFTAKVYSNIPNFSPDMLMINSGIGIGIVMLLFYFNWRALSLIQKDEELVKSADRIR